MSKQKYDQGGYGGFGTQNAYSNKLQKVDNGRTN